MPNTIDVEIANHVAEVTLVRPEKRNAISLEMFEELTALTAELGTRRDLRAVVLRGAGEHFSAGIDTSVFASSSGDDLLSRMEPLEGSPANLFQNAAIGWRELRVPVIACLEGAVFGGGLQLAMGADIRIASPTTRCSVMEIRWGIIPDMALTATMRHIVRLDHLKELAFTGRIVEADEAKELGLITMLSGDPLAAARELAADIARKSPDAVRAAKRLFNRAFDEKPDKALEREADLQLTLLGNPNQFEAVAANLEGREPRFRDPD